MTTNAILYHEADHDVALLRHGITTGAMTSTLSASLPCYTMLERHH